MMNELNGRFSKVVDTQNSVVVGVFGTLTEKTLTHNMIVDIARFYNLNIEPDKFVYHYITAGEAKEKGCKLPTGNFNAFLEIFK